jgi:site-specific DNA recombinase
VLKVNHPLEKTAIQEENAQQTLLETSPHYKLKGRQPAEKDNKYPLKDQKYGAFIRMSHIYSVRRGAIENHRHEIVRLCKERNIKLSDKHWFELPAVSGKSIWDHPEVIKMRTAISSGEINGIVVTKVARFCRSLKELMAFAEFLDKHNAHLISLGENLDTSTKDGKRMFDLLGMLAQWEREWISERVKDSIVPRAERGSNLGGRAKFGFRWVLDESAERRNWTFKYNPEEVKVCYYIRDTFFELQALRPTARRVSEKYKTRFGFNFSDSRIKDILTDPTYRGMWFRNTTSFVDGVVKRKPDKEFVLLRDYFKEPIFSEQDATRIDLILNTISQRHTLPLSKQKYLLTQIRCECGGKVYGRTERSGKRAYKCKKCPNKVPQTELDEIILRELFTLRDNEDRLAQLKTQIAQTQASVEQLRNQRQLKQQELDNTEEAIATTIKIERKNILDSSSAQSSLKKFQSQKNDLIAQTEELDRLIQESLKLEDVSDYLSRLGDLQGVMKKLSDNRRSRLVSLLIPEIILGKTNIRYTLDFIRQFPQIDRLFSDSTMLQGLGIHHMDHRGNLQLTGRD